MEKKHRHTVELLGRKGYQYCVSPKKCNPRAHGNVMHIEICKCGATRKTNSNGWETEKGKWKKAE